MYNGSSNKLMPLWKNVSPEYNASAASGLDGRVLIE